MPTKSLRDAVRLAIDIAGMRGSFTKAELVEDVYSQHGVRLMSGQDEREAHRLLLAKYISDSMKEAVDDETIQHLNVPRKHMHLLDKLPRTLCICTSGQHVLSIRATADDWAANSSLKRHIGEQVIAAAGVSQNLSRFLREAGRESLLDFTKEAA